MSPMGNARRLYAGKIAKLFAQLMPHGEIMVECAIDTADGTKVADVAWLSQKTCSLIKKEFSCSIAPEICVEVLSPYNSSAEMEFKKQLYLRAGATEFWICDEDGGMKFFNSHGPLQNSALCPAFPAKLES